MRKLALILAVCAGPAGALEITGNDLLERCNSPSQSARSWCLGFVDGIVLMSAYAEVAMISEGITPEDVLANICVPEGATNAQNMDVVLQKLREKPELRHVPAIVFAHFALAGAYPCN